MKRGNLKTGTLKTGTLKTTVRGWLTRLLSRPVLVGLGVAGLAGTAEAAPSYCTAVYSVQTTPAMSAINPSTGAPVKTFSATGTPNAVALNPVDGLLYYFDRGTSPPTLYKVDPKAAAPTSQLVGKFTNNNTNGSNYLVGAAFDSSGTMLTFWGDATISIANTSGLSFGTFKSIGGTGLQTSGTNGDLVIDAAGQIWAVANNTAGGASLYKLAPNSGGTAYTATKYVDISGTSSTSINGLAIDAVTNKFYISTNNTLYGLDGLGNATPSGAATSKGTLANVTDLASCGVVPDLPTLTKSFSANPIQTPATASTLTITVGNGNLAPSYLYTDLVDTVPAGMTVTTNSLGGTCKTSVNTLSATTSSITLAAGATIAVGGCTVTATVNVAGTAGSYTNTIASGNLQTSTGTVSSTASATLVSNSAPTIAKAFSPASVARGGASTLTFTLTNPNPGGQTLTNLNFTDVLSGMSAASTALGGTCASVASSPALAVGATALNLTVPNLAGGASCTISVSVQGNAVGTNPNTASGVKSAETPTAGAPSNTANLTVTPTADLAITKTDYTSTALSGQTLTYTIKVKNSGPDAVTGAAVTDAVPSGLSGVTWTCAASANSSCAAASGGGGVNTTVNLPSAGTATFTVRGTVTATGGTLANTASVAAPAGTSDPASGNNSATDTDAVNLSFCAARGGARGTNLLWSGGSFGSVPSGSSTNPPTVRDLASVATGINIRTDYTFVNKAQVASPSNYSPEDGEYNLSNSTSYRQDGAWHVIPDHTAGDATGQMMVVNAGTNLGVFYQETVNVTPNTNYELSAWIVNLIAGGASILPNFSIQLDRANFDDDNNAATADGAEGQIVYSSGDIPNSGAPDWRYAGYLFNSGGATQITVRFRNNNPGGGGNDLAIDDLSFTPCAGLPVGNVSGTLYKDRNNSGAFDASGPDTRLGGNIAVSLTDAGSGVTVTVNTDASGNYTFTNVPTGTYKIWVATADPDLGGLTARAPTNAEYTGVTLTSGGSVTNESFGFNAPGLALTKRVRNCGAISSGAACPAGAAFGTSGVGKPYEVLEYCIDYNNPGALDAANVVLTDLVPSNTTADLSGYGSGKGLQQTVGTASPVFLTSADAADDGGELTASQLTLKVASLAAGASGQVCFRAKIK